MGKFSKLEDAGGLSQQGIDDANLQRQLDDIKVRLGNFDQNQTILGETPEPCTPNYILTYSAAKHAKMRGRACANCSPGTERLKTVLVRTADRVDQTTFEENLIAFDYTLDSSQINSGHVEYPTDLLDPNTQYDLVRLVSIDGTGGRLISPSTDPVYNTTPITQFTTPSGAATPSKPTSARVVANSTDANADGVVGTVSLRIYADETQVKTFLEQSIDTVQAKLNKALDNSKIRRNVTVDDTSLTFVDVVIGDLQVGREYEWVSNTGFNLGSPAVAPSTSTINFFAGGYRDPSDGLASLTLNSYTGTASESGTQLLLDLSLTQPSPPYRLKNANLERSKSGGAFVDQDVNFGLQDPIYNTTGTIHIFRTVDVHPTRTYQYRETIKSVGGFTKQFTSGSITTSASPVSAQLSAQGGGPSLIVGGSLQASIEDDNDLNNPPGDVADAIYPMRLWETTSNSTKRIDNKAFSGGGSGDSDGVRWDSTNARLECSTTIHTLGGAPAVKIGKILHKNDVVVLCPSFLSNSADITLDITFALVDQGSGDMITETATAFPISHTTEKRGMWILIVPNAYAGTGKQWVEMRFGANPAQKVYSWNWQLDYGEVYRDFKINVEEKAVLDFADVSPINTAVQSTGVITESANGDLFSRDGTRAGPISLE